MRLHPTEEQIQTSVASFLDRSLPDDALWFHCPNGGARNKVVAAKLKWAGVKAGVPDILIVWRQRLIGIELKAKTGVLSEAQKAMHQRLTLAGAVVLPIARSVDEVEAFLETLGMPLKGRLKGRAA